MNSICKFFIILCVLILFRVQSIQTLYVDFCDPISFEVLYQRTDLMTVDYYDNIPPSLGGKLGYSRDFYGLYQFQNMSFVTWKFPEKEVLDTVFFVTFFNSTTSQKNATLYFSGSSDNVNFSQLVPTFKQVTDPTTLISQINYTITLNTNTKYLKAEWGSCSMDNCNDYFFPSIAHVCAWDSAKNKFDASWCFNREYSLFPYRYIPSYCGTFVLDSYLSWYQLIHRKNNRGGQISVNGDIELSLYSPHEGYGQNQLQLRVNTTFPSSFTEFIHPTQRFENFTLMNFDTLTFAVSAEPNTTFAMYFGTSTSMNSTTQAVPSKKIFSNLYHNFTSSNSSYTFILPLKEFNVDSNVLLQSINFVNFSSPSGLTTLRFRPIAFFSSIQKPRYMISGAVTTNKGINKSKRFHLPPAIKNGNRSTFMAINLNCPNISERFPLTIPVIKFSFVPTSPVSFDVVVSEGSCDPDVVPRIKVQQKVHLDYQRDEFVGTRQQALIYVPVIRMDKVVEILITNVEGDAFEIKDLMVSNDICYEPEDPSLPNFLPVKVRANFTRSPLANRTIVFSNANKKAEVVKRAILTHIEL